MAEQPQTINLEELSLEQLQSLRQELKSELQSINTAMAALKMLQGRLTDSLVAIESLKTAPADKDVLMPLTESMYVTGRVTNPSRLLVDITTGYFIEQDIDKAKEHVSRKRDKTSADIKATQEVLQRKTMIHKTVDQYYQFKIVAMQHAAVQSGDSKTGSSAAIKS